MWEITSDIAKNLPDVAEKKIIHFNGLGVLGGLFIRIGVKK